MWTPGYVVWGSSCIFSYSTKSCTVPNSTVSSNSFRIRKGAEKLVCGERLGLSLHFDIRAFKEIQLWSPNLSNDEMSCI